VGGGVDVTTAAVPPDADRFTDHLREGAQWAIRKGLALANEPRYRRLRWVLGIGLLIRLLLAPLTSWGLDTPYFTLSVARMLQTGSPYGGDTFFNPPLGPVVQLPLFGLLSLAIAPESFVSATSALLPVAIHTELILPYLPVPAALVVLKLPLIGSDALVALLLYHAVRRSAGPTAGTLAAAAWFLNPLVIWASSVHGEVDTLGALCVLAALLALERRLAFVAGILLGLGTFAKIYPVVLLPLAAGVLALDAAQGSGLRARLAPVGRMLAGLSFSALPFVPLLAGFSVVLAHQEGNVNYGGLSLLIVFNPNITGFARIWPTAVPAALALAMEATVVVGAIAAPLVLWRWHRRPGPPLAELPWFSLLALLAVAGSLLAILSTQAENVVAVLPVMLLAGPILGAWGRRLYWTLSFAAFAQYLTLLTPLAFFYPLLILLGPGPVRWANGVILGYALNQTAVPAGVFWVVLGVVGGGALALLWVYSLKRVVDIARTVPRASEAPAAPFVDPVGSAVHAGPRWRTARPSRTAVTVSLAAALVVIAMTAEVGITSAVLTPPPPPLGVQIVSVTSLPNAVTTTLRLTSGTSAVTVHFGLLAGGQRASGPVHVFADAGFPDTNGSYSATLEIAERVSLALTQADAPSAVPIVDAEALPGLLASGPPGTLIVLGGSVPDSVLSNTSDALGAWVAEGGTLIWAGGPLGGSAGHPAPGGFVWDSPGWNGQDDLVHYALSDAGPVGPLLAESASPLALAFGTAYNGTPTGANTTALAAHGGFDLGFDTPEGSNGSAPRSSFVYQPVGSGGVFFFGGAQRASNAPPLDVPAATFSLADDIALLLATGYVPAAGPSASATIHLAALHTVIVKLTVPTGEARNGLVALVTTPTLPTFLSIWSSPVPVTGP
jgi:hypothetical protein